MEAERGERPRGEPDRVAGAAGQGDVGDRLEVGERLFWLVRQKAQLAATQ